jgi:hypothetical protein
MTGYTRQNDTGQGATITFASHAFAGDVRMIGETKHASSPVKDTPLSATHESHIPGDTIDPGETELEVIFDRRSALPPLNQPTLITQTFPLGPGDATAATYVGSGFITERSIPQMATATLQVSKIKIRWDAKATLPVFTPATASPP